MLLNTPFADRAFDVISTLSYVQDTKCLLHRCIINFNVNEDGTSDRRLSLRSSECHRTKVSAKLNNLFARLLRPNAILMEIHIKFCSEHDGKTSDSPRPPCALSLTSHMDGGLVCLWFVFYFHTLCRTPFLNEWSEICMWLADFLLDQERQRKSPDSW